MDAVKEQPQSAQVKEENPEVKEERVADNNAEVKQENGAAPAESISDEVVRGRLLVLLGNSDLATTTEKMLRKQLEAELGVKLGDRKAWIREEVLAYLAKKREEDGAPDSPADADSEEEQEEETAARPKKRSRNQGAGFGSILSEPLQAFLGVESMPRPQVVKAIWAYIKEHNLQDPSNKRKIIPDQKLGTILTPPVDIFSMNKQLSKHCKVKDAPSESDNDDVDDGSDDEPKKRPAKRPAKAAGRKAANGKDDGDGKRKATGFCKPIRLSDELAAATGQTEMTRGAVAKWMSEYAKSNNLLDPSDKRFVVSDDTLRKLTGESRFRAFGCQKYLGKHFLKD